MRKSVSLMTIAAMAMAIAAALFYSASGAWADQLRMEVSATRLRAVEGGPAASYTLRPSADPGQTLTIAVSNPDAAAFTISPSTLTFTGGGSGNWNVPRKVTVTPLQDADADHEIVSLTHSAGGYANGVETIDVKVYLVDDEASGAPPVPDDAGGYYGSLAQPSAPLVSFDEHLDTGSYTLRLAADPGSDVTLNVHNPASSGLNVSPATLTFTGGAQGNWNSPQKVSITSPLDADDRNDILQRLAHTHSGTGAFVGKPVTVHVRDVHVVTDNIGVFGLEFLKLTEGDPAAIYTVRLARQPANFLRVNLSSSIPKSLTVHPETLTFTRENWDYPRFVSIQARHDLDSRHQNGMITHRYQESTNNGDWDSVDTFVDGRSIEVRTSDSWHATPILERNSEAISNILTFDGLDPSYTVRLDADPEREVTIDLRHDPRVTAYPRRLTFTGGASGNWAAPQKVTLQVLPDADAANEEIVVEHRYGGFVEASLPVTIIDGDRKSMIVYLRPGVGEMDEGESGPGYSVALADDPGGQVTMSLVSSHPDSVRVTPSTLTFDSQNYHQAQTVAIDAPEDSNGDNETARIVHTLPGYRQAEFAVRVQDNDLGGIVIWPETTTLQEGMPLSYMFVPDLNAYRQVGYGIRLARDPGEGRTVKVARAGGSPAGARYIGGDSDRNLVFTGGRNGNWNRLQWYILLPNSDFNNVSETYTVTHSATIGGFTSSNSATVHVLEAGATAPDPQPARYTGADMLVVVDDGQNCAEGGECDPEPPPVPKPLLAPSTLHLLEEGEARRYSIFFSRDPGKDVAVTITTESDSPASWSVAPLSFTFTGGKNGDWQTPRWVSVSALDDDDSRDGELAVRHSIATDEGTAYGGKVTAQGYDNDPPAVTISESKLQINEGATGSYNVELATNPVDDVTITPTSSDASSVTFSPSALTFTSSNWQIAKTIQVQAAQDADSDHETVTLRHAVTGYPLLEPIENVRVEVSDDDGPSRPTVSITADGGITEGAAASFTIAANPAQLSPLSVALTVGQNGDYANAADMGAQTVEIPAGGSLTYTVDTGDDGVDEPDGEITVTLNDGNGYSVSATQAAGTVTVSDDDPANACPPEAMGQCDAPSASSPEISVVGGSGIAEGGEAAFTITATPAPASSRSLWVLVTQDGDFGTMTSPRYVTIPTSGSVTFTVPTDDDQVDEADGWIRVAINPGHSYTVSSTAGEATVTVADNDVPEVSIAAGSDITEGSNASFTLTASPAPSTDLDVTVSVTQSGDYGVATGSRTVTIPTGGSYIIPVATGGDSLDEADGSVTVSVDRGTGYTVSSTAGAATVAVADDDPPAGQDQNQVLACTPDLPSDAVTVEEVTEWRDKYPHKADHVARWNQVLAALGVEGTGETPMTSAESKANESRFIPALWNRVTRTLEALEECDGSIGADAQQDEPAPRPEVSVTAGGGITEGGDASFTITANPVPKANLAVSVSVSQSGDYGVATGSQTVTIPTTGSYTLTVATSDDGVDEADGSVTATINTGDGYTVSSSAGAATVAVSDDDVPEISVSAGSGVTEGADASFTITADPAPHAALPVSVSVSQSGDYGVTTGTQTVTIPTTGSYTLTVATSGDSQDEADGSVTATVDDGTGYTVSSSAGAATVAVSDDDDPPAASDGHAAAVANGSVTIAAPDTWTGRGRPQVTGGAHRLDGWTGIQFSVSGLGSPPAALTVSWASRPAGDVSLPLEWQPVAGSDWQSSDGGPIGLTTVKITDPAPTPTPTPTPEVSVAAGGGITEGGDASFTITADPAPTSALAVSVTVTQSGDYGAATGSQTVTIPTTGSYTLTVATSDDGVDEADGSVTATVNTGDGYTVSSSAGATVAVSDDDDPTPAPPALTPEVSIVAGSGITEGGDASFTIIANPAPTSALTVGVSVSQSGDYGAATGKQTVTIPTSGSYTLTVATSGDSRDEADGSVTVTVNTGDGYTVSSSAGAATVAVSDDDDPPAPSDEVSVSVNDASAREDAGSIDFTVSLSKASDAEVRVQFTTALGTADKDADYVDYHGWLTFAPGETQQVVSVELVDDDEQEGDETVWVWLNFPTGGAVLGDRQGVGAIMDDD